jgi:uncharacterized protein (TIGR00266 family)
MATSGEWWMAIGGHQVGPVSEAEILTNLKSGSIDAATLLYGPGLDGWTAVAEVPRFRVHVQAGGAPPPALPGRRAHEIGFTVHGHEMQFVDVELDPGESAVAEAGAMLYMTQGIEMETVFGDGSDAAQQGGVVGALLGAGKRLLTGESLFITVYTNRGSGLEHVAFAAPYAGKIVPLDLAKLGGEMICQKDSFLCAARGVSIGIAFQKKLGVGLFGGEGFIMQRLSGDGLCFAHAGGTIHALDLSPGETLRVDTGCLVALQPSVSYDVQYVGKIKTALFGGEGIFFATLRGPGKVWLQSLPLSRLADRIYKAAPQTGGRRKGEGSILDAVGGLGNLIDGD